MRHKMNIKHAIIVVLAGLIVLPQARASEARGNDAHGQSIHSSYVYKTVGAKKLRLYVDTPPAHTPDAKVPAIVFFHGGGFIHGSVKQFRKQAAYLAARGMVTINVTYRLKQNHLQSVKDCVEDAISAMRWVRAHAGKLGIDPNRIAAGGGSAGGYLAAATLLIDFVSAKTDPPGVSAKPNALILFNPGFGGRERHGHPDPRDPHGKGDLVKYVKPNQPPMIVFFGTADPLLANARRFQAAYKKVGNRCKLITYAGQHHSFFNYGKYRALTLAQADKFLVSIGWLKSKAGAE